MTAARTAALAASILIFPVMASAQPDVYSNVSVSASQMYDANLFSTPASRPPRADLITRIGPALGAGFRFVPVEMDARYEVQAERYVEHPELNDNLARHDAGVDLRYVPNGRFTVSVNAQFIRTQTPGELNVQSQLSVGRAPAERRAVTSTASYDWSDSTTISASYLFGRDELVGGLASTANASQLGLRHRTSDRSSYRVDYEFRQIGFAGGSPIVSHVITAGRSYSITPRTTVEITAGPRLTNGRIRAELIATLGRQESWGELSLALSRTELTSIGEQGTIDVDRISGTARYRPARRLALSATPAYTHNARGDRRAPVYTLDLESLLEINRRLSLMASGRFGRQDGTLSEPRDVIGSRMLAVKLVIALPRSVGGDAPGRSRP